MYIQPRRHTPTFSCCCVYIENEKPGEAYRALAKTSAGLLCMPRIRFPPDSNPASSELSGAAWGKSPCHTMQQAAAEPRHPSKSPQRGVKVLLPPAAGAPDGCPRPASRAAGSCRLGHVDRQVHNTVAVAHLQKGQQRVREPRREHDECCSCRARAPMGLLLAGNSDTAAARQAPRPGLPAGWHRILASRPRAPTERSLLHPAASPCV